MKSLNGTKTHDNLKAAFAGESQANRRYLYFASKADVEGQNDVAALFRSTAEGETGHAHGHLDYLAVVGDPATDLREIVQVAVRVAGFALGGRTEEGGDVVLALDVRLVCEIEVAAIRLRFAGESILEILFRLCALEVHDALLVDAVRLGLIEQ